MSEPVPAKLSALGRALEHPRADNFAATTSLGIFARTFRRSTPHEVAGAVRAAGYHLVQLNLNSFGAPTIPTSRELARLDPSAVATAFADEQVRVWGVSATFNLIDPDRRRRREMLARAAEFIGRVPEFGAGFATLCTGTRDAENMWRGHPDNTTPAAWEELRTSLDVLLAAARQAGVRLGVEPERANVVHDATSARRLLTELGPDAELIAIVLDSANLLTPDEAPRQAGLLTHAFEQLGDHVAVLHAKDITAEAVVAPGTGLLDWELIARLRARLPVEVPVIVQDVTESEAGPVGEWLSALLARHPWVGAD